MASFNSGAAPNVVKTALDSVFDQEYTVRQHPQYATAETSAIFNQDTADSSAVIWELFQGTGLWSTKQEEQDVPQLTAKIGNQKTFTVTEFAGSVDIPKTFFDDAKHGAYEKLVKNFAANARNTRDSNAFALFRNATSTSTTADAVALISNSHVNMKGSTVDNLVSGALGETTLNTAIIQLLELKTQDDVVGNSLATTLLVPPALYKSACEITESELRSGGPDNDMNVYSDKYGIKVYTSAFLGTAAGGSDAAWFLLGNNHSVQRFVRQGVQTELVPWQNQRNNNYIYKGSFREVVGAMSYDGLVGSTGS